MERNINVGTYLSLNEKSLKETKKGAKEEAIANLGDEDGKDILHYPELNWDVDELYFEDGELHLSGSLFQNGKDLGYLSPMIPLGNETLMEIFEYYEGKLKKVRDFIGVTK